VGTGFDLESYSHIYAAATMVSLSGLFDQELGDMVQRDISLPKLLNWVQALTSSQPGSFEGTA
jgi:hypothetical protein